MVSLWPVDSPPIDAPSPYSIVSFRTIPGPTFTQKLALGIKNSLCERFSPQWHWISKYMAVLTCAKGQNCPFPTTDFSVRSAWHVYFFSQLIGNRWAPCPEKSDGQKMLTFGFAGVVIERNRRSNPKILGTTWAQDGHKLKKRLTDIG